MKKTDSLEDLLLRAERGEKLLPIDEVELPSLPAYQAEFLFLEALHQEPSALEETSQKVEKSSIWSAWLDLWRTPRFWLGAFPVATVLGILLFWGSDGAWWRASSLLEKGQGLSSHRSHATLYVGLWDEKKKVFQRLSLQSVCSPSQSLVFGVKTTNPGGYAYLVRWGKKGKARLLFPFSPANPKWFPPQKLELLQLGGVVQQYLLAQEKGPLRFLLLQSPKPLTLEQQKILLDVSHSAEDTWLSKIPSCRGKQSCSVDHFSLSVLVDKR